MKPGSVFRRAARTALDLVLPPHCPACDDIVADDGDLCRGCFAEAHFVLDPCCALCASPFPSEAAAGASRRCLACIDHPPPWDAARAAFVYDAFSRRLILPLKYADRTENAAMLGAHMARAGSAILAAADLVVPVPLHPSRLRSRRYNQAVLLARASLPGRARRLLPDGLIRQRMTAPLAARTPGERRRELDGAIAVRPSRADRLRGARVVLVDDVLTTGSTAAACTAALRQAGAASVALLVAARTVARVRDADPLSCAPADRSLDRQQDH